MTRQARSSWSKEAHKWVAQSISRAEQQSEERLIRQLGADPRRGSGTTNWQGNANLGRQPAQPEPAGYDQDIWDSSPASRGRPGEAAVVMPQSMQDLMHDPIGFKRWKEQQGSREATLHDMLGAEHFSRPVEASPVEDDTDCFPIKHMANACGLKIKSLRKWEQEGILPPCTERRGNQLRYYSKAYIQGIEQIAIDEGLHDTPRRSVNSTRFSERAWNLYHELHPGNA